MATERLRGSARYLSFPFRMTGEGAARSGRIDHVREQIAQILLTQPGERVFLPDFGIGAQQLLFLPMSPQLWARVESALAAGVAEALRGEAEPGSILVTVGPRSGQPEVLDILIRYRLAALNLTEEVTFTISSGALIPPGSQGTGG